ncbi:MAG: M23 family metallopeptidase [Clostridia bacterium]|jgi:murein DD-endopeptidase MepM/ murein hydrolase activator NlpD|nr:M23 family metallopeptidase [Clostridia bacterium]MBQ5800646.1 M23 family metallopeptidase [Clostridia bacterium]
MEKNENSIRANRILYIVIVAVLCITAIVIGITAAMQKDKTPSLPNDSDSSVTTKPPVTTSPVVTTPPDTLPSFASPAEGTVAKAHDLSVLVYSVTMDDLRVHCGIDISANSGDDVLCAADGEISKIYSDPLMGSCIEITHSGGAVSIYKNLSEQHAEGIEVGKKVEKGQIISYIGDTAMIESADEPHLHYELTIKGVHVDPMEYISTESRLTSLTQSEVFED